ncbi:MAG: hypothetical protein GY820_05865, partial [Gammaproteobacteria bacterium]|nr:hypothetical protein [Gammaproteobacteria bacterium]
MVTPSWAIPLGGAKEAMGAGYWAVFSRAKSGSRCVWAQWQDKYGDLIEALTLREKAGEMSQKLDSNSAKITPQIKEEEAQLSTSVSKDAQQTRENDVYSLVNEERDDSHWAKRGVYST